jgi:acyl transferase domain-containing protein
MGNDTFLVPSTPRQRIFLLSGFDEYSCQVQVKSLYGYLLRNESVIDDIFLDDIASTLSEGRTRFMWKTAVTGSTVQDLAESLSNEMKPRLSLKRPTLAFVFTGQGAQWAGMGKELLDAYPIFCDSISRIDGCLAEMGAPFKVYGRHWQSTLQN